MKNTNKYAIEMRQIVKKFGTLVANDHIDLLLKQNTIHGIVGENGAGKSTLMSILFGLYKADHGQIFINGEESKINSPLDATEHKIGMVHQHFKLVSTFNAIDNILLGKEPGKFGMVFKKEATKKIKALAKKYHFDIDFTKPVSKLTVGQQQKIEILKTLYVDANILIFDEPTAVLTPQEIEGFLDLLLEFKKDGKSIIIITHKLDEIKKVCDEATVIRKGKFVKTVNVAKTTPAEITKLMVGREVVETKNNLKTKLGESALRLENVSVKSHKILKLDSVSFDVKQGEIVAIAGVEGNGQSEIINAITGLEKPTAGKVLIKVGNKEVDITKKSIKARYKLGMSHIPEDRHKHGLILDDKLTNSLFFQEYFKKQFSFFGILKNRAAKEHAKHIIDKFDVRGAHEGEAQARALSGGNQQKAIVGRELLRKHNFIVIAQPTRGLDVGAIEQIHKYILDEKQHGRAVLLISYELSEVIGLADRVIVVNAGRKTGEVTGKDINKKQIGELMTKRAKAKEGK